MSTAIYARISLDRQDGAGVSRQLEDCRSLASRNGWKPVSEFVDNDISASRYSRKPRPAYRAMLEAAGSGEVNRVVVYHIDRLYRQPRELEDWIDLADQGRVQVVSAHSGDIDLANSDGRAMARVLVAMAAKESDDKSRRIKRAKQQAREQGRPHGGPRALGWIDGMTPEPMEAAVIREAVEALLAGTSMSDITRQWNTAGVRQPQTGQAKWTPANVRQIMANPRHAGLVGFRAEIRARNGPPNYARPVVLGTARWPAIVARERWELLQAVLLERGAAGRMPRRRSLLTGLLQCGCCGATMVRSGGHSRNRPDAAVNKIWRCPSGRACGRVSIDAVGLESLVTEATIRVADTMDLASMVTGQWQGGAAADLVAKLEELDRRLDSAAESYAQGRLPPRAFERATAIIQHEQQALRKQFGQMAAVSALDAYAARPGMLRDNWPRLSLDQRRAVLSAVIKRIVVSGAIVRGRPSFDPERVSIEWRF